MINFIKRWYEGEEYYPFADHPKVPVFPGIRYRRHWSSRLAHIVVEFYLKEWKWLWPLLVAIVGIIVAIGKAKN